MNIAILGMGNVGTTLAADLTLKGNKVNLIKTSKSSDDEYNKALFEKKEIYIIEEEKEKLAKLNMVTDDFETGLKNTDLIIITIQTNYHEELIKKIYKYLDKQIIYMIPGYMSTMYFKKYLGEKFENLIFVEGESSPIDCRVVSPGKAKILFKNVRNPISVFPKKLEEKVFDCLKSFEYNFTLRENIIESALHNPNLIVHTTGAIMSIPRIEYSKGDYSMYKEVFTPTTWNMVEDLDREKNKVLKTLGLKEVKYVEACKFRNSLDELRDAEEIFFDYAQNSAPKGPSIPNSRYLTEDVPEGLVLLESLANELDIQTPICTALINLSNSFMKTDYRKNGRTLEKLKMNRDIVFDLIKK